MILITGAAGFIGSTVACAYNRRGHTDLVLCDSCENTEKWKNLLGVRFKQLIDPTELFQFLDGDPQAKEIKTIIHLGACADTTETNVDFLIANNVDYSIALCEWAKVHNARFVYASSGAVYGDGSLGFSDADDITPNLKPLNAYGFSKWLFDMWVLENGLIDQVAGLRFFNVFGPNEYHKGAMASVIFRAFPLALKEGKVRLFESYRNGIAHGEQARDFIYIDEVLDALFFVAETHSVNGIFNVGTGRAHTFNDLAKALLTAAGKPLTVEYFPMPEEIRSRYQYHTQADMTRLGKAGYAPPKDRFFEYVQRYVTEYLMPGLRYFSEV